MLVKARQNILKTAMQYELLIMQYILLQCNYTLKNNAIPFRLNNAIRTQNMKAIRNRSNNAIHTNNYNLIRSEIKMQFAPVISIYIY
jgi:hypothetical protein